MSLPTVHLFDDDYSHKECFGFVTVEASKKSINAELAIHMLQHIGRKVTDIDNSKVKNFYVHRGQSHVVKESGVNS